MKDFKNNNEKYIRQVKYVKPILTFEQLAEIINERIDFLEKAAKQIGYKKNF